jgi:hypothetical protein
MKLFVGSFTIWIFALFCGGTWANLAFTQATETAMLAVE